MRSRTWYYGGGKDRNCKVSKMDREISTRNEEQRNEDVVVVSVFHVVI